MTVTCAPSAPSVNPFEVAAVTAAEWTLVSLIASLSSCSAPARAAPSAPLCMRRL